MEFISDQNHMEMLLRHKINTLFIDFDDTLVDYLSCQNKALDKLMAFYNLDLDQYPQIYDLYFSINNSLWPELEKGNKTIPQIRKERFEILQKTVPLEDEPLELDKKYLEFFIDSTKITGSKYNALEDLKNTGYNIIITTNGIRDTQLKRIQLNKINNLITQVITSEDVGEAKPSPLMYYTALNKYNISNEEAFVIGDSLRSDILGANNANIRSCWINQSMISKKFDGPPRPDIISKDFESVAKFIFRLKIS